MAYSQSNTVWLLLQIICPSSEEIRTGSESWKRYGSAAIFALSRIWRYFIRIRRRFIMGSAAVLLGSAAVLLGSAAIL